MKFLKKNRSGISPRGASPRLRDENSRATFRSVVASRSSPEAGSSMSRMKSRSGWNPVLLMSSETTTSRWRYWGAAPSRLPICCYSSYKQRIEQRRHRSRPWPKMASALLRVCIWGRNAKPAWTI
jgi:hypothetical protein